MRRTKIVATLGPACSDTATLTRMVEAGLDAARLNFSHGSREDHEELADNLRAAEAKVGRPVALVQDLQGVKVRVEDLDGGSIELVDDALLTVHGRGGAGSAEGFSVDDPRLVSGVEPGSRLLLADGHIELEVTETRSDEFVARVVHGGTLSTGAGITAPTVPLPGGLTEKDQRDILVGRDLDVDYVAASFVASRQDIADVKELLAGKGENTPVVAKVERREALDNLDGILEAADGILVARGDLGIALPPEDVPVVQKRILQSCARHGTLSITATQMLESMIRQPRPTRAETSDVANAILDGTHAVMLSGETAVGAHPVRAVAMMARIAERVEQAQHSGELMVAGRGEPARTTQDAIAHAAATTADDLDVQAIIAFTNSGSTARMIAKYRPRVPLLAASPAESTRRRLALLWGTSPIRVSEANTLDEMVYAAENAAKERNLARPGDHVAIVAGEPGVTGTTNMLRISTVK